MSLDLSGDLERLQLTIEFIAARFIALVGIIIIQVFVEIFGEAIPNILLYNYLAGTIKSIVATRRIIIIPLKDLLL